ncbi:unknown [Clostridium sp. CAG:628]|nr:unknown [Clostridium sp. CAG:628]
MGKTLSGTLYIEKGTEKPFNGGTLVEAIKYYNPTIKTRTDFSSVVLQE